MYHSPTPAQLRRHSWVELHDERVALNMTSPDFGNDSNTDGKRLVVTTAPNKPDKFTFLRNVGLAQPVHLDCRINPSRVRK
jgi:hypothetical protein